MARAPQTLFDKVWRAHEVSGESADAPAVLYIDLHLIHEVTSPQAFAVLRERGLRVRRPERTLATMDHSTPTLTAQVFGGTPIALDSAARQVRDRRAAKHLGRESRRGMVHGGERALGASYAQAALAQHREGLRGGDLVNQVQVDVEHRRRVGALGAHLVTPPHLVEQGLRLARHDSDPRGRLQPDRKST